MTAAVLGAAMSAAAAAPALATITPGAFCKKTLAGSIDQSDKGFDYVCEKKDGDIRYRWLPIGEVTPPLNPSPAPSDSVDPPPATALPKTGPGSVVLASAVGGIMLTGGGAAVYLTRRRRFVA